MSYFKNRSLTMQEIIIHVFNMVGSGLCVEADDGQKVYDLIKKAFHEGKKIKLSFQNVEILTSAFLNTAIGQLYRDFSEEEIKSSLSMENMLPEDVALLKRVTGTAKLYSKDPDGMQKSINEILGEEQWQNSITHLKSNSIRSRTTNTSMPSPTNYTEINSHE